MKQVIICIASFATLVLIGCGDLEDRMLEESGVLEDPSYIEYSDYELSGQLDEQGYYLDDDSNHEGAIHLTFGNNNNLQMTYYTDESQSVEINPDTCFVSPGTTIYADESVKDTVFSSMYVFSGIRMYTISDDGSRRLVDEISQDTDKNQISFTIPSTISSNEVYIEPIGEYEKREILLSDAVIDDGKRNEISGKWMVNDIETTEGKIEISPVSSYVISYEYDNNDYFYVGSSPECYYQNNEDGIVIFKKREPSDDTEDYEVNLHSYITVRLVSDMTRTIRVNDSETVDTINANNEKVIDHLKYGDRITIQTNKEWVGLEKEKDLILTNTEILSSGEYKYTLYVPEEGGEFKFNPTDFTYEHGEIEFKCFGEQVNGPVQLAKKSKIYYSEKSADPGYWLAGDESTHFVEVSDEADTIKKLKDIHFTKKIQVQVSLPKPKCGGYVTYKLNDKVITTPSVNAYSGEIIKMSFSHWEGWKQSVTGEILYTVGEEDDQIINANGKDITKDIFEEDEDHKPELTLNLDKNVGTNLRISVEADGYNKDFTKYDDEWKMEDFLDSTVQMFTSTQAVVDREKIGTYSGINLKMDGIAIPSKKAIKVYIEKIDKSENVHKEIRYIDDLAKPIDPIVIYQDPSSKASVWYKAVNINVSMVDVLKFSKIPAAAHSSAYVINADTKEPVNQGAYIEGVQEIILKISPDPGYYITGENITNSSCEMKMDYESLLEDGSKIINDHPIGKFLTIQLDESDKFAKYTYTLDGANKTGTIKARSGQTLKLEYEITDPKYTLKYDSVMSQIGNLWSSTSITESITITDDLDGKTITRSTFGIEVNGGTGK